MEEKQLINLDEVQTQSRSVGVSLPLDFHRLIRQRAADEGTSLSDFLRSALVEKLARAQKRRRRA